MEENNRTFIKGALLGALLMLVACVSIIIGFFYISDSVIDFEIYQKLNLLNTYVEQYYLYDVDDTLVEDGIYEGYVYGLNDSYSMYYNEEETVEKLEDTSGEFVGIGVLLTQDLTTGVITFMEIYEESPAEESGILAGDILESVDGESVSGLDLSDDVVGQITGEEGTYVEIGIIRGETGESEVLQVERRTVETHTVEYEMVEGNIGYITVSSFNNTTASQFQVALESVVAEGGEGIVVDLRNNLGGSLEAVCDMLDMLLPESVLVYTEDKYGTTKEYYATDDVVCDLPLVVLVNEYSASASEVFSGCIQDYERGTLVGTTTYGKGIVQNVFNLGDGTLLKLTVSEYFTPNGRNIHGTGIDPDVVVDQVYDDEEGIDEQYEEGIEVMEDLL